MTPTLSAPARRLVRPGAAALAAWCLGIAAPAPRAAATPPPDAPALLVEAGPAVVPAPLAALMQQARRYEAALGAELADLDSARRARDTESGALWPRLDARLGYTRNQHESVATFPSDGGVREVVITPRDALEAQVTLTVPLLELGRRKRLDATDRRIDGRVAGVDAAGLRTDEAVAEAWFQGVLATAQIAIAKAEVDTARARVERVMARSEAGLASPLDRARAIAEVEAQNALVAQAELALDRARVDLERLTGTPWDCEASACPVFALAPLESAPESAQPATGVGANPPAMTAHSGAATIDDTRLDALPAVRAASAEAESLALEASAAELDLVPTIDAFVSERVTNASGFGSADNLSAGITATFRLDLPGLRRSDEVRARARAARLRVEVERRAARSRILSLEREIESRRAALTAARAQTTAREAAYEEAIARRAGGTATALDELTAQRDRLAARLEVARAEAELGLARVLLALASGGALSDAAPRDPASGGPK